MPIKDERLVVDAIPAKYDRVYKVRDNAATAIYDVNVARLECTCPEFVSCRAFYPPDDARRICVHVLEKLYTTKVENGFDPVLQLFVRYGRTMYAYRVVEDSLGVLIIGQPFGPGTVRAIGQVAGKPVLATYHVRRDYWSDGETDLGGEVASAILSRMRAALPEAFRG